MTGTSNQKSHPAFEQDELREALNALNDAQLDDLPFGVIGFGQDGIVTRYNRFESEVTGLAPDYVRGKHLFTQIAQCMNNFMVAQQFEDAWSAGTPLDAKTDYVLTWRMKPTKVKLRMLWAAQDACAYVVLSPRTALST